MGLSSTNVAFNMATSFSINVDLLSGGIYTLKFNASDEKDRIFFPHSETTFFMTKAQLWELTNKLNQFLVPAEDACESCEKTKDICDCVPCNSCGHDTAREDIYMGYCLSCEDQRMVRNIR